jgi:Regulator of G protein signaling domain
MSTTGGDDAASVNSVEYFLSDPIRTGFLLAFTEARICSENIKFIIEVDNYKDHLVSIGVTSGPKSWREIDVSVALDKTIRPDDGIDIHRVLADSLPHWEGTAANKESVLGHVRKIWNLFLSNHSPMQICVPSTVRSNTVKRLEMLNVYLADVFGEALLDPTKTLKRDTIPSFLASGKNLDDSSLFNFFVAIVLMVGSSSCILLDMRRFL